MRSLSRSHMLPFRILALTILAAASALVPWPVAAQVWSWVTVTPPGENFSVRMPKQPSQEPLEMPNMPNLSGVAYSATGGRIYYTVKSIRAERGGSPQSRLSDFVGRYRAALSQNSPGARLTDVRPVNLGGFAGQQFRISTSNGRGLVRVYSTRQRIYVLEVAGGDEEDAPVTWFLDSFSITEPPPSISDPVLPRNPSSNDQRGTIKFPPTIQLAFECGCDQMGNPANSVLVEGKVTREAIICTKGDLELTDEAIKHQFNGDVILEVEFLEDGTVGEIKVVQSQPHGLVQKAIDAARQYKFCPALKDGRPVTQITELVCSFSVKTIYTQRPAPRPRGRRRP